MSIRNQKDMDKYIDERNKNHKVPKKDWVDTVGEEMYKVAEAILFLKKNLEFTKLNLEMYSKEKEDLPDLLLSSIQFFRRNLDKNFDKVEDACLKVIKDRLKK